MLLVLTARFKAHIMFYFNISC